MTPSHRAQITRLIPGLRGQGVLLASPLDADRVRRALTGAGFALAEVPAPEWGDRAADTLESERPATSLREAQAAIAQALRLPESAGRNLDAMADSLRDLPLWWPEADRVALLWHGAEALVDSDLPGFLLLSDILRSATRELWRGDSDGDRAFETIAFVERHGVRTLPREADAADPDHDADPGRVVEDGERTNG